MWMQSLTQLRSTEEQKGDPVSDNVLSLLEHIDDDAINYEHPIKLVRIDDDEEAKEGGFTMFS
jgi:hypothetical protein